MRIVIKPVCLARFQGCDRNSVSSPFFVTYVDCFQENGCLNIVMKSADGGDIAHRVTAQRGAPFSEAQVLDHFIQICLALKHIHDEKILEDKFQLCHTQVGIPSSLSPKICQGRGYDAKTNIWSLGCVPYELCTLSI
jgi:NIMA (never in mitosis gene a)-related kinase